MLSLLEILLLILQVAQFIILAHIIMSWLINFNVLNLRQPLVYQIWDGLNRLLEPVYGSIRSILPQMGGLDLARVLSLPNDRAVAGGGHGGTGRVDRPAVTASTISACPGRNSGKPKMECSSSAGSAMAQ